MLKIIIIDAKLGFALKFSTSTYHRKTDGPNLKYLVALLYSPMCCHFQINLLYCTEFFKYFFSSHQILWNNLEEKSQDISQIEHRRRETSEEDENSDRIKSKFETVKAIPAAAEDENSFSSRRKKNVIRGFKKRSSPKTTSEVKHEAETIDLRANSGMARTMD